MENSLPIYQPILSPFLDKSGIFYVGDRKGVSLIFQKNEEILQRYFAAIQKPTKNSPAIKKSFNQRSTKFKISPLHVAVMTGQLETAKKLLVIMKANPNLADHRGWTPLHHATLLENDEMIALLKEHGASEEIKNHQESTPAEIHDLLHPKPLSERIYKITEDGDFEEITPEQFEVITGARYIDEMVVSSKVLAKHWAKKKDVNELSPSRGNILTQYHDKSRDAETLALQAEGRDENGHPVPIGASVVAKRDIKKGELITEYLGVLTTTKKITGENVDYKLSYTNGEHARNLGPMIPDGWPNAAVFNFQDLKGLPERSLMFAVSDIPQGTPVAWDYGTHPLKRARIGRTPEERSSLSNRYIEVFPTTTDTILQKNHFYDFFLKACKPKGQESINHLYCIAITSYVLNTPVVFMKHALKGNIRLETIKTILRSFKSNSPFIFTQNPMTFQLEAIFAIMEVPGKYTMLRSLLLSLLNKGYLCLTASLMATLYDTDISKFQDIEGFSPDEFDDYKDLILELMEEDKPFVAYRAALNFFNNMNSTTLKNLKNMSKRDLKWYFELQESKNPMQHEIIIDKG